MAHPTKLHRLYFVRNLIQTTKRIGKLLFSVKASIEINLSLSMFVILVTSIENGDIYRYRASDCLIRKKFPDINHELNSNLSFDDIEGIFKKILLNMSYDNKKDNIFVITTSGNLYGEKIERYKSTLLDITGKQEKEPNLKQRSFNHSAGRGDKCGDVDRVEVIANPHPDCFKEFSNNFALNKNDLAAFETFENNRNRNRVMLFHDSLKVC